MTGYVRPAHGELRVREQETYRAAYCGICHALSRRYGFWARMLVNYDYVFLALLFGGDMPRSVKRRCAAHPLRRRCAACGPAADRAADATVLFAVWKLRDGLADGGFFERIFCRFALFFLKKAMKRAESLLPGTAAAARESMARLRKIEEERLPSIDAPADTFAEMLASLCEIAPEGDGRRVAYWVLYHLGRWIYIADACDDIERDARSGLYNPVAARFGLPDGRLDGDAKRTLETTLAFSRRGALEALALWPGNPAVPILENILALGLLAREREIFDKAGRAESGAKGTRPSDEGSL